MKKILFLLGLLSLGLNAQITTEPTSFNNGIRLPNATLNSTSDTIPIIDTDGIINSYRLRVIEQLTDPIDPYYSSRLSPINDIGGFLVESTLNKATGYFVENTGTGTGAYAGVTVKGSGADYFDNLGSFQHFGDNYFLPYLAANTALYGTEDLYFLGAKNTSNILFRLGTSASYNIAEGSTDSVFELKSNREVVFPSLTIALIDSESTGRTPITREYGAANYLASTANLQSVTDNGSTTTNTISVANLDLSASNPFILGNDADGVLGIASDVSILVGAGLKLYGSTHIGQANDIEFMSDGAIVGSWNDSANLWSFSNALAATGLISTTDEMLADAYRINTNVDPGIDTYLLSGIWTQRVDAADAGTRPENSLSVTNFGNDLASGTQLASSYSSNDNGFWVRRYSNNAASENGANAWQDWKQLLTVEGFDALKGGSYLRSDVADIKTSGDLTFNDNINIVFGNSSDASLGFDTSSLELDLILTDFNIKDNGTTRFTFERTTGKFGINATSPWSKLDISDNTDNSAVAPRDYDGGLTVSNSNTTADAYALLKFPSYGAAESSDGTYIKSVGKSNNVVDLVIGEYDSGGTNREHVTIQGTTGNVGIGNSNDIYKLDVSGTGRFTGAVTIPSDPYDGTWDGLQEAAPKDAIYDEIQSIEYSKSIRVALPTASEDISVFFTNKAITITEMRAVLIGAFSPSVTWTISHGTDRSATGAEVVTGGTTTTSVTTGSDVTTFNDATIVADSFVWLETTAQSGTVNELFVEIIYTID